MNFDETLVWVAADLIWEAWREENERKWKQRDDPPSHHRTKEFPFTIYEGNEGLHEHKYLWTPHRDAEMIRQGHPHRTNCPEIVESLDGSCVCPPWMACYCCPSL